MSTVSPSLPPAQLSLHPLDSGANKRKPIVPNSAHQVTVPPDFDKTMPVPDQGIPDHFCFVRRTSNDTINTDQIKIPELLSTLHDASRKFLYQALLLINNHEKPEHRLETNREYGMCRSASFSIEMKMGGSKRNFVLVAKIAMWAKTLKEVQILQKVNETQTNNLLVAKFGDSLIFPSNSLPPHLCIVRPPRSGLSSTANIKIPELITRLPDQHLKLLCNILWIRAYQLNDYYPPEYRRLFDYSRDLYKLFLPKNQQIDQDLVVEAEINPQAEALVNIRVFQWIDDRWGKLLFSAEFKAMPEPIRDGKEMQQQWHNRFMAHFGPYPPAHPDQASAP